MSALLLRLAGPTQAWDSRRRASQYDSRHGSHVGPTGLMPTSAQQAASAGWGNQPSYNEPAF